MQIALSGKYSLCVKLSLFDIEMRVARKETVRRLNIVRLSFGHRPSIVRPSLDHHLAAVQVSFDRHFVIVPPSYDHCQRMHEISAGVRR